MQEEDVAVTLEQGAVQPSVADGRTEERREREAREVVAKGEAVPRGVRSAGILVLSLLAVVYTLYVGQELILPIVLALVLKLLLAPALDVLQQGLQALENIAAANRHEGAGEIVTAKPASTLAGNLMSSTATILSRFFTTMVLLFFLLASGDRLLRGFVEVLPTFSNKRQAVAIAQEIETNITGYLVTITIMNALVGVVTGLAMWACGLDTPLLWGATAFLLNFIPILGPLAGIVIFFVVGVLSLDWPWFALLPAGLYMLIHVAEGEVITPMLLAKRFTLNPVLVIASLFFWHMLWGIPGALLAVPLLAMMKIVSDRVEPLKPLGHIIGS
jgi:predicted PurR-regulated permease PerM